MLRQAFLQYRINTRDGRSACGQIALRALNQSEDDIIQIQADAEAAAQLLRAPPVAQTRVNIAPRSQKAPRSKDVMPAQENEASRPRIRTRQQAAMEEKGN
ncbi:hypothetical protein GQ607_017867 [Colletotrichum asianum]|uniref:Uncharacterized protein n=1 Tax=Colletotrichum asianum TaxID=702518 RepID=A0A8H3ZCX8_9PEZI|nr:hypothetical protein GQ607_017867 [Colletotrichum asianum]